MLVQVLYVVSIIAHFWDRPSVGLTPNRPWCTVGNSLEALRWPVLPMLHLMCGQLLINQQYAPQVVFLMPSITSWCSCLPHRQVVGQQGAQKPALQLLRTFQCNACIVASGNESPAAWRQQMSLVGSLEARRQTALVREPP